MKLYPLQARSPGQQMPDTSRHFCYHCRCHSPWRQRSHSALWHTAQYPQWQRWNQLCSRAQPHPPRRKNFSGGIWDVFVEVMSFCVLSTSRLLMASFRYKRTFTPTTTDVFTRKHMQGCTSEKAFSLNLPSTGRGNGQSTLTWFQLWCTVRGQGNDRKGINM